MYQSRDCVLGLDLGTTSLKCAVICKTDRTVVASSSINLSAYLDGTGREDVPRKDGFLYKEQDTRRIIASLVKIIWRLPESLKKRVASIGTSQCSVLVGSEGFDFRICFCLSDFTFAY